MDLGKVLTVSFDYELVSGTLNFSGTLGSQTLMVYIYDATAGGASWIQPAGFLGMNQSSGPGRVTATFQSSVVAGQKYRVAVIASQAVGFACSLEFDNFTCSRVTAPIGPVVTDWVTYLPTITNLNAGTAAVQFYRWRRVGDSIQVMGNITAGGASISIGGDVTISLPSGLSFDLTKMFLAETVLGTGSLHDSGVGRFPCSVNAYTANSFALIVRANAATGGNTVNSGFPSASWYNAAGDSISFEMMAPIQGWSSSVQMSNDTDTRVVAFSAAKTATQSIPHNVYTIVDFNFVDTNTHGSNYAAGAYTVPVSGFYRVAVNYNFQSGGGGTTIFTVLYKNGVQAVRIGTQPFSSSQSGGACSTTAYFNAGDTVSIGIIQLTGSAQTLEAAGRFTVDRLSGPSVVAANETVAMRYSSSSGQSIPNNLNTIVVYGTKDYDTHGFYNSSSGTATIPVSGKYRITAKILFNSYTWPATTSAAIFIYKNGVIGPTMYRSDETASAAGKYVNCSGSVTVNLAAGDTIQIYTAHSQGTTINLLTDVNQNFVCIERVGN
jgi:hypothetical protein